MTVERQTCSILKDPAQIIQVYACHAGYITEDDAIDSNTKIKIEHSIKKAFYLCFQGLEKNEDSPSFYLSLIQNGLLKTMYELAENFPAMQVLFTRTLFTPIKYCDVPRREVENHGHDDYSRYQPHVVDCEACNCSIFQLCLRYNHKMPPMGKKLFSKLVLHMNIDKEMKKSLVCQILNNLLYILDGPINYGENETPQIIEIMLGYCLNKDIRAHVFDHFDPVHVSTVLKFLMNKWKKTPLPEEGGQQGLNRTMFHLIHLLLNDVELWMRFHYTDEACRSLFEIFYEIDVCAPIFRSDFVPIGDLLTNIYYTAPGTDMLATLIIGTQGLVINQLEVLLRKDEDRYLDVSMRILRTLKNMIMEKKLRASDRLFEGVRHFDVLESLFVQHLLAYLCLDKQEYDYDNAALRYRWSISIKSSSMISTPWLSSKETANSSGLIFFA